MSARDELARDIFIADNSRLDQAAAQAAWEEVRGPNEPAYAYGIADGLTAARYRKPRTITTVEEIRELPALTIVVYDDTATGGLLQTYVVPDDGTVMFKDCGEFHLMTFGGDYIDAKDMPLPLTAVYEVGA